MKYQQAAREFVVISSGLLLVLSFQNCAKVQPSDLRDPGPTNSVLGEPSVPSLPDAVGGGSGQVADLSHDGTQGGTVAPPPSPSNDIPSPHVSDLPQAPISHPESEVCEAWDPKKIQLGLAEHDDDDNDKDDNHDRARSVANDKGGKKCDDDGHRSGTLNKPVKVCAPEISKAVEVCLNAGKATVLGDEVKDRRGVIVIDAKDMRSIENLRGSIVIRGDKEGGRVKEIKNLRGSVLLCGVEVDSMSDISGRLVLVNSNVKSLTNQRGHLLELSEK